MHSPVRCRWRFIVALVLMAVVSALPFVTAPAGATEPCAPSCFAGATWQNTGTYGARTKLYVPPANDPIRLGLGVSVADNFIKQELRVDTPPQNAAPNWIEVGIIVGRADGNGFSSGMRFYWADKRPGQQYALHLVTVVGTVSSFAGTWVPVEISTTPAENGASYAVRINNQLVGTSTGNTPGWSPMLAAGALSTDKTNISHSGAGTLEFNAPFGGWTAGWTAANNSNPVLVRDGLTSYASWLSQNLILLSGFNPSDSGPRAYLRNTPSSGVADVSFIFGAAGDKILMCDTNNDGIATPMSVHPEPNGTLTWKSRATNALDSWIYATLTYGHNGDTPVCGDWDGNGTQTPGVVWANNKLNWDLTDYLNGGAASRGSFVYGNPGNIPVVGDWDGNRTQTPGIVWANGSSLVWELKDDTGAGPITHHFPYGSVGNSPVVGDWNGNGIDTPGVVWASGGTLKWDLTDNFNGGAPSRTTVTYGNAGWTPTSGRPFVAGNTVSGLVVLAPQ